MAKDIRAAFFGMFMGAVVLGVGIWEFRTGQGFRTSAAAIG